MTYVVLPEQQTLPPITYDFAVEAYVARHFRDDDYFFIWQTKPTVIVGRNQLLQNEVNVDYCREHGVFISRRKSGGGCVYSDEGNVMFSFISREPNVQKMFEHCMHLAADALHRIGVPVTISGRNDILLDGKKVSGAACSSTPTSACWNTSSRPTKQSCKAKAWRVSGSMWATSANTRRCHCRS